MGSQTEKSEAGASAILVKGFKASSIVEVEKKEEYDMVTGDNITVVDGQGNVLFTDLRGFMPLAKGTEFLIRKASGKWYLVKKGKLTELRKVNLQTDGLPLMFDPNGKIRYKMQDPTYPTKVVA